MALGFLTLSHSRKMRLPGQNAALPCGGRPVAGTRGPRTWVFRGIIIRTALAL